MPHSITLEALISFLLDTPLFGELSGHELAEIVHILQVQRVRAGQKVFREGEAGDGWFVVMDGDFAVTKENLLGPDEEIARLGRRACFGEMAVIDGSPRSASVVAVTDGTLLRFSKADFDALIADDNLAAYKLVFQMAKVLSQRQRKVTSQLTELVAEEHTHERMRHAMRPVIEEHSVSE